MHICTHNSYHCHVNFIPSVSVGVGVGIGLCVSIVIIVVIMAMLFHWLYRHHRKSIYGLCCSWPIRYVYNCM